MNYYDVKLEKLEHAVSINVQSIVLSHGDYASLRSFADVLLCKLVLIRTMSLFYFITRT